MKTRELTWTAIALLVIGCASAAYGQPDHNGQDAGPAKHADKGGQGQGQARGQQKQAAQPQHAAQRPAAQGHAGQRPGMQGHAMRQPMGQRMRAGVRATTPPVRASTLNRNRLMPPSRQVVTAPIQSRPGPSHADQQAMWPRFRARNWTTQHQSWDQRGGYHGYRIPSAQFALHFGRPHRFHLSSYQVRVVGTYPEFHSNGFWFTMLDPVPEYWSDDWYDTDDVSVVQMGDGYYLIDESYPDVMVSVSVGT